MARRCSSVKARGFALGALGFALAVSGCAAADEQAKVEGPVTVYVSLPLTGPRSAEGKDAADGARLALAQAEGKAGDLEVRAEYLDDARGKAWDPAAVGANARTAVQDSSTAAYIGELDSQPTRGSLPITNDAGVAQVSPGAGGIDLTRPAKGYEDSPDRYRPSGNPTFARVIPDDAVLIAAVAEQAAKLGASLAGGGKGTPYDELEIERAAGEVGLEVVPSEANADVVLGFDEAGQPRLTGERDYLISPALDPSQLPKPEDEVGLNFTAEFRSQFQREPGPYAAYGFESMALVLDAIGGADHDAGDNFRGSVIDRILDADRPDSVLGTYSITDDGDTTLCAIQPYVLNGKEPLPEKPICP